MGRLIDVAELNIALGMEVLYGNKTAIQVIQEAPTVEAIPKAEYEARLKADMVAMLTEIQLEIEEIEILKSIAREDIFWNMGAKTMREKIEKIIQQKINALKENEDATN